ncbi:hypothetical protein RhiirA5_495983 [Rhizophagus irregularis]|uniref:Bromo domain-containing protein n=2 Tax=Rhizophagus irregularis TaxID=588596 RepID=A0A2N0Q3I2_9GLOM|nr:hypothetical protein RhiirA5_495983 [Rhizophagus irregularis]CAB4491707.1 unnamed protein product [Rhizophagus irregularis]
MNLKIQFELVHFISLIKKLDAYNLVINPMDLFTINLKLVNNQYSNPSEFKDDMNLIFNNCFISNDIGTEMYNLGKELNCNFKECWTVYYYQEQNSLEQELFHIEPEDLQGFQIEEYSQEFQFEQETFKLNSSAHHPFILTTYSGLSNMFGNH